MSRLSRALRAAIAATIATASIAAAGGPGREVAKLTDQPDAWFATEEGRRVVADIRSWQNANGGWWKAYDVDAPRPTTMSSDDSWHRTSTIDNGATYSEMRILARAARCTRDADNQAAFERGLRFLLAIQYPNGGWPQRYPIEPNYGASITLNDDAMINVMRLLRDVGSNADRDFAIASPDDRAAACAAVDRGIECILDAQITVDGTLTAWCQQHDPTTLAPVKARAYELPSICTSESAAVVDFLMDVPHPSERIKRAIDAAIAWFEAVRIENTAVEILAGPQYEGGRDVRLTASPGTTIWARFYDLKTQRPFVCDRDGVSRTSLDQIGHERRVGYAWYNARPAKVIARYATWKVENER